MKIYTVHIKPEAKDPLLEAFFIPEGFNLSAAIFQAFWALYHKMWFAAIFMFLVNSILLVLDSMGIGIGTFFALSLSFSIYIGFIANDWHRKTLEQKGYVFISPVSGLDLIHAKRRFYENYLEEIKTNEKAFSPAI